MNGDRIPDPTPELRSLRSVEEIDEDLAGYAIRELRQRDLLLGSLTMLDAIAQRRDVLLDQRSAAVARARATRSAD